MKIEREAEPCGEMLVECGGELRAIKDESRIAVEIGSGRGIEDHPVLTRLPAESPNIKNPTSSPDADADEGSDDRSLPREQPDHLSASGVPSNHVILAMATSNV
jgi:hypothetical protein